MTKLDVTRIEEPMYIMYTVQKIAEKCGFIVKSTSAQLKLEENPNKSNPAIDTHPKKNTNMWYVDVETTNGDDVLDDVYDKFYTKVGLMVIDNNLNDIGYDISPMIH